MSVNRYELLRVEPPELRPASVVIIALQHLLPSLAHLMGRIRYYGFRPNNIWLMGKPYSTIRDTERKLRDDFGINVPSLLSQEAVLPGEYTVTTERMAAAFWQDVIGAIGPARDIILLDEGGLLRKTLPHRLLNDAHRIVAIEHTSSGWKREESGSLLYPVILKARSFAKLRFESPFIARSLMCRLARELKGMTGHAGDESEVFGDTDEEIRSVLTDKTIGILGFGHLGGSVCRLLHGIGLRNLLAHDKNPEAFSVQEARIVTQVHRRSDLVTGSDIILGCTGTAIENIEAALFAGKYIAAKHKGLATDSSGSLTPKVFGSCSSGDREFSHLIPYLTAASRRFRANAFDNATGQIGECSVTLLNGGFPLNFDRNREYEPLDRIALTRELTLASIIQAHRMLLAGELMPRAVKLDVTMQMEVVNEWIRLLAAAAGIDVSMLTPKDCETLSIPHPPPLDASVWRARSEGEEIVGLR
jgi:hypothetical protein